MHDFSDFDDAALLRESDKAAEAFAVFYRRHVEAVLRFFAKRHVGAADAADLTAEVFAAALITRRRYRPDGGRRAHGFSGSLGTSSPIADACGREQRARQRLRLEAIELTRHDIADYEALCADEATAAWSELPEGQREVVHARVVEGRDYKTIARDNGLSEAAARQRVSRALAALRGRLMEQQ